jgi:Domain of unknown function (DUF4145)
MAYIAPAASLKSFTCPHCGVLSRQYWWGYYAATVNSPAVPESSLQNNADANLRVTKCEHCSDFGLWVKTQLVYPEATAAPSPNPDLPENVKADYQEAASILVKSPRGAAALLRLAIQKLCIHLGGTGENLNADIAALVKGGLPPQVQQALDAVRVIGNNAVHPGQMDVDDVAIAADLFSLVNLIADYMISMPAKVAATYAGLPPAVRAAIEKRDAKI